MFFSPGAHFLGAASNTARTEPFFWSECTVINHVLFPYTGIPLSGRVSTPAGHSKTVIVKDRADLSWLQ